jgi:hypothetical protein
MFNFIVEIVIMQIKNGTSLGLEMELIVVHHKMIIIMFLVLTIQQHQLVKFKHTIGQGMSIKNGPFLLKKIIHFV